jgi:hypothetical protein
VIPQNKAKFIIIIIIVIIIIMLLWHKSATIRQGAEKVLALFESQGQYAYGFGTWTKFLEPLLKKKQLRVCVWHACFLKYMHMSAVGNSTFFLQRMN